jgi:predicted transcriptional regulator
MRTRSPLAEWRERYGLSPDDLANLCGVTEAEIIRMETGETGLVGEVQDYLTGQGANVSMMAAGHSAFRLLRPGSADAWSARPPP